MTSSDSDVPVTRRADRAHVREDFDAFVAASADRLLRTAYLVTWDLGFAEDLVQECFVKVARRWPRIHAMDYPLAYARRILLNLALDDSRRRARERSELDHRRLLASRQQPDARAERSLHLVDVADELSAALATLATRQRAVLVLRYLEDLPEADVAAALGCSVGTVKSTASRALEHLRSLSSFSDADAGAPTSELAESRWAEARPDRMARAGETKGVTDDGRVVGD